MWKRGDLAIELVANPLRGIENEGGNERRREGEKERRGEEEKRRRGDCRASLAMTDKGASAKVNRNSYAVYIANQFFLKIINDLK